MAFAHSSRDRHAFSVGRLSAAQHDVDRGMTSTVSSVEEARPNSSEIARPWKIGSVRIDRRADHGGQRGQQDRLEPDGAGLQQHLAQRLRRRRRRGE